MLSSPAKRKVFGVILATGSSILRAPIAPIGVPASTTLEG